MLGLPLDIALVIILPALLPCFALHCARMRSRFLFLIVGLLLGYIAAMAAGMGWQVVRSALVATAADDHLTQPSQLRTLLFFVAGAFGYWALVELVLYLAFIALWKYGFAKVPRP